MTSFSPGVCVLAPFPAVGLQLADVLERDEELSVVARIAFEPVYQLSLERLDLRIVLPTNETERCTSEQWARCV